MDIAIADAVVDVLLRAADQLPDGTIIERRLLPIYTTGQLKSLRVAVAPRMQTRDLNSRSTTNREHMVQVAPHLMASSDGEGQVDEATLALFVGYVETIADIIERAAHARTLFGGATFTRLSTDPLYDPNQLLTPGVMRSVLTLTFRRIASPPVVA